MNCSSTFPVLFDAMQNTEWHTAHSRRPSSRVLVVPITIPSALTDRPAIEIGAPSMVSDGGFRESISA